MTLSSDEFIDGLVSIITPTFNSEDYIIETYNSIKAQTYTQWEWIVTDDCSSDHTVCLLKDIASQDKRVFIYENKQNVGAGAARNNSLSMARGQFIAFLDSDDLWDERKLAVQIGFMKNNGYILTYTSYQKIDEAGNLLGIVEPISKVNYNELLKSNVIGCLTAVYDRSVIGTVYMPTIRKRQDMALWLNILKETDYAYCITDILASYRVRCGSLSSNKIRVVFSQWRFYRSYMGFGLFLSGYYFLNYIVRAFLKHNVSRG